MSDSRNLNCSQDTTTKWAVSNEWQHLGVAKKTPIEPGTDGRWGQVMRGDGMSASPCSRHRLTHANPMPTKKTEPKLRSVLWKMIPPLNSLYYLGAVKDRHFEPHAERFEHETPLWF